MPVCTTGQASISGRYWQEYVVQHVIYFSLATNFEIITLHVAILLPQASEHRRQSSCFMEKHSQIKVRAESSLL